MWTSASTPPWRKMSRAFFERTSTWWYSMSLGRPAKGRRSRPTTWKRGSRWSRRATSRPSRPAMPVTRIVRGGAAGSGGGAAGAGSPVDTLPLLEPDLDHRLDRVLDRAHLLLEDVVVVVGVPLEAQRLAEV